MMPPGLRKKPATARLRRMMQTAQGLFPAQVIIFTGLPFLRPTDKGLADVRNKKLLPLFLDD